MKMTFLVPNLNIKTIKDHTNIELTKLFECGGLKTVGTKSVFVNL